MSSGASDHLVQLDTYTLDCVVDAYGYRYWAPFDGPVVTAPPDDDGDVRVGEEWMSRVEAERVLIEMGMIAVESSLPARPISPWKRNAA